MSSHDSSHDRSLHSRLHSRLHKSHDSSQKHRPRLSVTPSIATLAVMLLLAPVTSLALPDDAQQPILTESSSTEMFLDRGYFVYRGTAESPARITQGSMEISGEQITVERIDGVLKKVTATGNPAQFQQQPDATKALIHASGNTLVFDNTARLITADENAEFHQDGSSVSGFHIEYNLETRSASATGRNADDRARMLIPATQEQP